MAGVGGSGEGTVRRRDYRNNYKGHMDKIKGEGGAGGCLLYTSDAADELMRV